MPSLVSRWLAVELHLALCQRWQANNLINPCNAHANDVKFHLKKVNDHINDLFTKYMIFTLPVLSHSIVKKLLLSQHRMYLSTVSHLRAHLNSGTTMTRKCSEHSIITGVPFEVSLPLLGLSYKLPKPIKVCILKSRNIMHHLLEPVSSMTDLPLISLNCSFCTGTNDGSKTTVCRSIREYLASAMVCFLGYRIQLEHR